ncbi:protein VARIATION IN COMPOUND TRIGGERED ROOT growth response-like [Cryptomeria japonica]|uniref:protein VARIATION IN COMPOUND TRIGGERED ROOT growth response-like n=1 Tax=Cryptomeria japonica TaxID=3369 RepID=UPI0027DA97FF|nr:protein VARIATION IN COMPOUND TRIGGERED ROOT growth response-like [Cryptomeria japonica]
MGREIASKQSPYRLSWPQKIDNIKEHFKKGLPLRGIQYADALVAFKECTHQFMGISSRRSKRLRRSTGLQILYVEGNEFREEFSSLSEDLVWLRWDNFPLRNLPSWLTLRHLSVLELYGADMLEDLWDDNAEYNVYNQSPLQLRELIIKGDRKLEWLPSSIGRLQCLKKLDFKYCGSSLPNEFCDLHSMEYLKLYSEELSSLPADFGNLISLKHISLKWFRHLIWLPDSFQQLRHLEDLDLSFCKMLSSLPEGIGNFVCLKYINLKYCTQLRTLPESFKKLIRLEHLYLSGCAKRKLKLDILENIRKLKFLGLSGCEELEDLPNQIVNQTSLRDLDLTGCIKLRGSPANIGELVNLQSLTIESLMFECLQLFLVNLPSLNSFKVEGSASVRTEDPEQVYRISICSGCCPNLETFSIWKSNHLIGIETVPVSLKML